MNLRSKILADAEALVNGDRNNQYGPPGQDFERTAIMWSAYLDGRPDTTAQVKNYSDVLRAIREGLKDLETQRANADTTHAVLFVRRHGGQWIAVMTVEQYANLIRETL